MKKKEIEEYIKSKSITQDNYIAPTVQTHVDTRNVPAMAKIGGTTNTTIQPVKIKNISDVPLAVGSTVYNTAQGLKNYDWSKAPSDLGQRAGYVGKQLGSGLFRAGTSIVDAPLQEVQNDLETGAKRDQDWYNKNALLTLGSLLINPSLTLAAKQGSKLFDKEYQKKNTMDKILDNVNDIVESTYPQGLKETVRSYGTFDKQYLGGKAPKNIENISNAINKPSEDFQKSLEKESLKYKDDPLNATNLIGGAAQSVGFMGPSILASAVTKDPSLSLATMGVAAKGASTREALDKGMDLDKAIKIGNAKALTEVGTEMLTGGVNLFGKGALDEITTKAVNNYVKKPVLNFLAKQGVGVGGEILEEVVANTIDNTIDKFTTDPNRKIWDWNEFWDTVAQTTLSTLMLNGLTGGYGRNAYNANLQQMQQQTANQQAARNLGDTYKQSSIDRVRGLDTTPALSNINTPIQTQNTQTNANILETQNVPQTVLNNEIRKSSEALNLGKNKVENTQQVNNEELSLSDAMTKAENDLEQGNVNYVNELMNNLDDVQIEGLEGLETNQNINQNIQENIIPQTTLQDSATEYGYKGNSQELANIDNLLQKRGINARFDNTLFDNNDINAIWTNDNGQRQVIFNPNASENTIVEEIAVHELTHDLLSNKNTNINTQKILDYVKTLEGYNEAIQNLEQTYSQMYPNRQDFQSLIEEEAVADVLGRKLGNQEFVNQITNSNPSLARRIYNWVIDKLDSIVNSGGKVKSERLFWQNVKNNFEKAYNMEYQSNDSSNAKYNIKKDVDTNLKTTQDNQGRTLSKQQQNYFKDSKIRDNNGDLLTVYHTMTDTGTQFNEFNPVGTEGYKFGDQTVNFFTDSKTMSGSYADYKYKMADTRKLNSITEAKNWVKQQKTILSEYDIKDLGEKGYALTENGQSKRYFKDKLDLLKNIKQTFYEYNKQFGSDKGQAKYQYEGYLNIKNPYIIDAKESNWDSITTDYNEMDVRYAKEISQSDKQRLMDLVEESKENYKSINQKLNSIKEKVYDLNDKYRTIRGIEDTQRFREDVLRQLKGKTKERVSNLLNEYEELRRKPNFEDDYFRNNSEVKEIMNKINDEFNMSYSENDLYKMAEANFDEESLKDIFGIQKTTNEIIKEVLNKNKNGANYDGVVIKNVLDYGSTMEFDDTGAAQDIYITFDSNQFKNVDNKTPTSDSDIRYSKGKQTWNDFLNENIKSEGTKTRLGDLKTTGQERELYWKEQGADDKVAKILSEVPKEKTSLKDTANEVAGSLYRNIVSKGGEIEKIAFKTNKPNVNYTYDKMLRSMAEAQQHIGTAQADMNYNKYTNFTDSNGNKVSMSLNDIRNDAKNSGISEQTLNEYLAHKLNEYRYKEGKPVFGKNVTSKMSTEICNEIEKQHPKIKRIAGNVWQFEQNQLKNLYDSGLISEARYNELSKNKHYVRIQRQMPTNRGTKITTDKNGRVQVNQPIQAAKGGNQDIMPIMEGIAKYTTDLVKMERTNESMRELGKALGMGSTNENINAFTDEESFGINPDLIKDNGDGTYTMTYFDKGVPTVVPINKGIYDAYVRNKAVSIIENSKAFKTLAYTPRKISQVFRSLTTNNNPLFMATNFFKDIGDAPFNSKYTTEFAKTYLSTEALRQVAGNGVYNQLYNAAGGNSDSYFVDGNFTDKTTSKVKKGIEKLWSPVQKGNEIVESVPRVAEFIATIKANGYEVNANGELVAQKGVKPTKTANEVMNEALYNAAEITTNFKRGGDVAKSLNRNGATFLNASIQGFDKQIRNFKDAFASGDKKQIAMLLTKALIFGIAPTMLNDAMNGDDDEYEEMPDYQKDNYYLFKMKDIPIAGKTIWKNEEDKWIRIPKGRAMSVLGSAARRTKNFVQGDKNAYSGFVDFAQTQVAPNSIAENNILAPFSQVKNNKSWSGNKIIPDSIAKRPTEEQYNEKTDAFSKWLGQVFKNIPVPKEYENFKSPMAINYLIDQYTGAIGDVVLPMTAEKATSDQSPLIAPITSKFTTDSAYSNKSVSDFYDTKTEIEKKKNSVKATGMDTAKNSYMTSKNMQISNLYKEQREIQSNSSLSKKEKYKQAREVQKEINNLAKETVEEVKNAKKEDYYIKIGDYYYKKVRQNGKDTYIRDTSKKIPTEKYALYDYFKEKYEKSKERD